MALDDNETPEARADQEAFKRAVRDWVEAHFTSDITDFAALAQRLGAEITKVGLHTKESDEPQLDPAIGVNAYGTVSSVDITTDLAFKDGFIVTIAVGVFCGADESVYAYRRTKTGVARILEAATTNRAYGEALSRLSFSVPDGDGNQLALLTTIGAQCASNWNTVRYRLFRVPPREAPAVTLLDQSHSSFEASERFESEVLPAEFTVEMRDRSVDGGLHNRTHYLRYRVAGASVERVDPVALQAQDFVDEWVTRPWTEMESRSAATSRETLGKWHEALHADFVAGMFTLAQPCKDRPGVAQFGIEFHAAAGHDWPEPLAVFFLVRELRSGGYQMLDVSFNRQEGCPGEGEPRGESPWCRLKK